MPWNYLKFHPWIPTEMNEGKQTSHCVLALINDKYIWPPSKYYFIDILSRRYHLLQHSIRQQLLTIIITVIFLYESRPTKYAPWINQGPQKWLLVTYTSINRLPGILGTPKVHFVTALFKCNNSIIRKKIKVKCEILRHYKYQRRSSLLCHIWPREERRYVPL